MSELSELNELSELQSLDFAFGAFLAGAFAGYADIGPKGWREFIKRPVNKQIFRHDADTPAEFMTDFLSSQKAKKVVGTEVDDEDVVISQTTVNAPSFPVIYYFRKPGLVNTQDQKGARKRVWMGDKAFRLQMLPVAIDYNLVILAWDKLTLDKLTLAWAFYIYNHDAFLTPYQIGSESFDVRVSLMDNKNVAMQNATDTTDGKRLYAATTPVSIMTNILCGREIDPPGPSRVIFGWAREREQQFVVALDGLAFSLDTAFKDGVTAVHPGTVRVMVGARTVATDDGHGVITGSYEHNEVTIPITGTVDYYNGIVAGDFGGDPGGVISVSFVPLMGRLKSHIGTGSGVTYDDGWHADYDDGSNIEWG